MFRMVIVLLFLSVCIKSGKLRLKKLAQTLNVKCGKMGEVQPQIWLEILIKGIAIRCFTCSSLYDDGCGDDFSYSPTYMTDCSMEPTRGIIPVQHCRLIRYFGEFNIFQ